MDVLAGKFYLLMELWCVVCSGVGDPIYVVASRRWSLSVAVSQGYRKESTPLRVKCRVFVLPFLIGTIQEPAT